MNKKTLFCVSKAGIARNPSVVRDSLNNELGSAISCKLQAVKTHVSAILREDPPRGRAQSGVRRCSSILRLRADLCASLLATGAVVCLGLLAPACGESCSEEGCEIRAELRLSGVITRGDLVSIEVSTEDGTLTCESSGGGSTQCTEGLAVSSTGGSNGATLPATDLVNTLVVQGMAEQLHITIDLKDGTRFEGMSRPEYVPVEINGAGCGTCLIATEKLMLIKMEP